MKETEGSSRDFLHSAFICFGSTQLLHAHSVTGPGWAVGPEEGGWPDE